MRPSAMASIAGATPALAGAVEKFPPRIEDVAHAPRYCGLPRRRQVRNLDIADLVNLFGFRALRGRNDARRLHAQRQGRRSCCRKAGRFDVAVPGDGDGAAGGGHRESVSSGLQAEIAVAAWATCPGAAHAGGRSSRALVGCPGGTDRPGLAFGLAGLLRHRPSSAGRAVLAAARETAGQR